MHIRFIQTAVLSATLSVILGAFGAHALKQHLSSEALSIFETGVRYQLYHSIALLATGMLHGTFSGTKICWAGRFFMIGMILFSGSLYLLALLLPNFRFIGAITPLGGLAFITGWLLLFLAVSKKPTKS